MPDPGKGLDLELPPDSDQRLPASLLEVDYPTDEDTKIYVGQSRH